MLLFVYFLLVARLVTLGPLSGEFGQIEVSSGVYSRERAAVSSTTPGRLLGVLLPRGGLVLRCELEPDPRRRESKNGNVRGSSVIGT